jgi:hypothetical protein
MPTTGLEQISLSPAGIDRTQHRKALVRWHGN